MRLVLPKHGRSHKLGGSDPGPQVTYLQASKSASQSVTTNVEVDWTGSTMRTNDLRGENNPGGTFGFDTADPKGILIYRHGIYMVNCEAAVTSGDTAKLRSLYSRWSRLSGSITFGNPLRPQIGEFQGGSGISEVTAFVAKTSLYHWAIVHTSAFTSGLLSTDPIRLGMALIHVSANDYSVGGTAPSTELSVVRLGELYNLTVDTTP